MLITSAVSDRNRSRLPSPLFSRRVRLVIPRAFPTNGIIELTRPPYLSTLVVKYLNTDGVETTLPADQYEIDETSIVPRVMRAADVAWPATQDRFNAVSVTWKAGYVTNANAEDSAAIAARFKQAMLLLVSHFFENPGAVIVGTIASELPFAVKSLLWTKRVISLAGE